MDTDVPQGAAHQNVWQVVGAAVQGVSHLRQELPCQDAVDYCALPGDVLLVALADGAGSADLSDIGAREAVASALGLVSARLEGGLPEECCAWHELFWDAFAASRKALERLAEERGEPLRSLATTLTFLAAIPDRLVVGQLGDGAVVARDKDGVLSTITRLQRGEYANETNFLTQEDALDQVVVQVIDQPVQALAVMSDGLTRLALKMPSNEPHLPFFQPLFAFVEAAAADQDGSHAAGGHAADEQAAEALSRFLASERVCERTDDDKALVLAVRPTVKADPETGDPSLSYSDCDT